MIPLYDVVKESSLPVISNYVVTDRNLPVVLQELTVTKSKKELSDKILIADV